MPTGANDQEPDEYPNGWTHRPLMEQFTSLGCPPCMGIDPDVAKLWKEFREEPGQPVTFVSFHQINGGSDDEFASQESKDRYNHYSVQGTPDAQFDGGYIEELGGGDGTYDTYKDHYFECGERDVKPTELRVWQEFKGDHVVFCLEGKSWRRDVYPRYKMNRKTAREALTVSEKEEEEVFWETFTHFKNFIDTKTNCTIVQHDQLEADDLIAGWVNAHPDDNHIIISTDGDFAQLIKPNVKQYNGIQEVTITHEGYFDNKKKPVIDKKTGFPKKAPNPKLMLFEKCVRGDPTDNVFSAYPGVRAKGTKKKVGLLDAFEDRETKGYNWNNLMLQRWIDQDGEEHRVVDDYNRNVILCDLNAQPPKIKAVIKETIASVKTKAIEQVGLKLIKFCAKWDMQRIAEYPQSYAEPLNAKDKQKEVA
mgnify:CR=1 FL=1